MTRVAAGDRAALAELYDLTVAKLLALARVILGNAADAEEVVCDAYTQVWRTAAEYDERRGGVLGWLLTICRSRALDRRKQRRSHERIVTSQTAESATGPTTQGGPEDLLDVVQQGSAVHRALDTLTPLRRRLLALAFFHDLSHTEIAAVANLPIGTVKSHIRRALAALREELAHGDKHATRT